MKPLLITALALVADRPDGTLGPKVKPWSGACPAVMPALIFPAPRRALVNGPPLEDVEPSMAYCPTGYRVGGITADGVTMATVVELLSLPPARTLLGTITQDQTGLTGRYAMELDYLFTGGVATSPAAPEFGRPRSPPPCSSSAVCDWFRRRDRSTPS